MGTLLQVIGFGWALIGAANIFGMFGSDLGEGFMTFGFLLNVMLFILPGLVVGALGTMLKRRRPAVMAAGEEARIAAAVQRALEEERAKR